MKTAIPAQLFQLITEESIFGIAVFDVAGECIFVNRMATQLLGQESPKLDDLKPLTDHPQLKSFSNDLIKHDGLYQDIMIKGLERSIITNLGVKTIEIDGVKSTLLQIQDVTLQKKMQREITAKQNEIKAAFEELLQQNRQLKELDHAKDRFIALTTHELRTPLSAMVASIEILKFKLYDSEEQMQEFVDMTYEQGGHLQELVNDILDFAKIQAGKMDFYIEQQNVVSFASSVAKSFEGMAEQNQVSLKIEAAPSEIFAYYDELRLRQILSNIVNNAIKYNRPEGDVRVYFEDLGESVKVLVQDSGKGIAPENHGKVFNEFETVGQVNHHTKGTGLGMPISRKLAEGMGGKLEFTSAEGVGSTFWIEIPKTKILGDEVYQSRLLKGA